LKKKIIYHYLKNYANIYQKPKQNIFGGFLMMTGLAKMALIKLVTFYKKTKISLA
jgi:hypothetical protein